MSDVLAESLIGRHDAIGNVAQFFTFEHLPEDLRGTSEACHDLAIYMLEKLPDSAELTHGLRKLLEAKDCFVRATVAQRSDD